MNRFVIVCVYFIIDSESIHNLFKPKNAIYDNEIKSLKRLFKTTYS